jgi:sugar O-acyltransferase (sialic acid O-acetyltransferase NeuD family)
MNDQKVVKIIVPKETVNDDSYIIRELPIPSGAFVKTGDIIIALETSKALFDVEASADGYLFYLKKVDDKVEVGETVACIAASNEFPRKVFQVSKNPQSGNTGTIDTSERRFTKNALELINKHHIDPSVFNSADIVIAEDVQKYIAKISEVTQSISIEDIKIPDKNSLVIIGGGGHAKMCIDIIKQTKEYHIYGLVDPKFSVGQNVLDVPVVGNDDVLESLFQKGVRYAVVGVGAANSDLRTREKIFSKLKTIGFKLPSLIHPSAIVEASVEIGDGNQLMAGCIVGSSAVIKNNNIINSGAIVSHDCVIGDNVHIAPGAVLGGNVTVAANTLIGMGVTVYFGCKIGRQVMVMNGLEVFENIPDGRRVVHDKR